MSLPSVLLLFLLLVVAVAAVGGVWPALAVAVGGFLLVNWYFTPPLYTFTIAEGENLLALVVFVTVAAVVSSFVALTARRAAEGLRARAEAETLGRLAGYSSVESLLEGIRRAFGFEGAAVFHRDGASWLVEASSGQAPPSPDAATETFEVGREHVLAVQGGGQLAAADRGILNAYATELAASIEHEELEAEASSAGALAAANELRTSILSAVSHDLRTPLAATKASVSSLRQRDVDWTAEEREEFLATIEEETDRLNDIVGNLLDMSRLQTGSLEMQREPVSLEEVLPAALRNVGPRGRDIQLELPRPVARGSRRCRVARAGSRQRDRERDRVLAP